MKILQDKYYKKFEADNYFSRWLENNESSRKMTEKKLRSEKKEILKILKKNINLKNKKILEIGCFIGDLLYCLKSKYNCTVKGVEPSKKAVLLAKNKFKIKIENKIFIESKFFPVSKENSNQFDIIICDDVLSWFDRDNLIKIICSIDNLLKKNGYIFFKDFSPSKNFAFKNHHYSKKNIYNFKQANGHKMFFLSTGKYKLIYNKNFFSKKYQKITVKDKEAIKWNYALVKKINFFTHPIKNFDDKI